MGSNPRNVSGGTFAPADGQFKLTIKPQGVRFLSRGVQPPSAIYVENEDDLAVSVASSVANEAVTFNYRLLRFDGEIIEGQFVVRPASNRAVLKYAESLAEGFLLSMSCQAAAATTRGQTFVRVSLTSPAFTGNLPSYMLMADYVTTAMAPAHPNGRVLSSVEGPGNTRAVTVVSPGAGNPFALSVPANARWKVHAGFVQLVTGGAAGNRSLILGVLQGGFGVFQSLSPTPQGPGATVNYWFSELAVNNTSLAAQQFMPMPPNVVMLGGDQLQGNAIGLLAADQLQGIVFGLEEWLDNV